MCDSTDLSGQQSKKCKSKKTLKTLRSEALDRQTVNKKSFSDRICDDLCEEILQYLSLEDKLKLEDVSKQFQRTVLKKHCELTIKAHKCSNKRTDEYFHIENIFIDLKSLEVLLKKCPNITSIDLRQSKRKYDFNPVFRLITKFCNNLRQIDFEEIKINIKNIEEFQLKFGSKIKFIHNFKDANNYNLFPNIEKLKFYYYSNFQEVIPRLKLNKLKNLELTIDTGEEDLVKTFVDTFPKLTHFYLDYRSETENAIYNTMQLNRVLL